VNVDRANKDWPISSVARDVPVPVLLTHSVSDTPAASIRALSVRPAVFAAQLNYLRQHGFTGLTFGELCQHRRAGQPLPEHPIVLTFDDGLADFIEEALPMLMEHGFPATVFVATGWLDDAGLHAAGTPPDRTMSWAQLAELSAAGVEIGAHSHSHPQLDQISEPRLRAELADSKHLLEDRLGHAISSLAYPCGYSNKRVREVAREVGYLQAAVVANVAAAPTCDPFSVPRLIIRRSTSLSMFARIANQRRIRLHYTPAYVLTKGYTVVRRTRSVVRTLSGQVES
jgi:peptidoglycan/xylan/chitin deacetylase (PgdA/CDA1 family)